MNRKWKPGDVAMVRHDSSEWRTGIRHGDRARWNTSGGFWFDAQVSEVRPLVVIDPEDREQVERLLCLGGYEVCGVSGGISVENMQAALREFANPKPPKPDEPMGLGAVVEDGEGEQWVRVRRGSEDYPWAKGRNAWRYWEEIDAVRVLSEGVPA